MILAIIPISIKNFEKFSILWMRLISCRLSCLSLSSLSLMLIVSSTFQREFSINLWAGLVGNYVIGPFELPHRLNGNGYYEFLTRDLPGLLEEVPQQLRRDIWFMHDAAPPHFSV
jgi:hypothetical protein